MLLCKPTERIVHMTFSTQLRSFQSSAIRCWQNFENERYYVPGEEPLKRIKHGLTYDFRRASRRYKEAKYDAFRRRYPIAHMKRSTLDNELLPFRSDFVIIGGGLTGSSTAYWLRERFRDEDLTITVIENTENFSKTRTMLGTGIISPQFSNPELVEMANFSAEFIRHAGEHLKILDNEEPDINLLPVGFLHLARNEQEAAELMAAWKIQIEKGCHTAYWGLDELKRQFPFMNFDDVVAGTIGLENEGVFDSWQLLSAIREKNLTLGVRYIKGEVEGFKFTPFHYEHDLHGFEESSVVVHEKKLSRERLTHVVVRPQMTGASARPIECFQVVNAAGPWSGEIAKMAGIGKGPGILSVPLPIVCKRRTNFIVHAPDVPPLQMPALVDPTAGIFCRPDNVGYNYVVGRIPSKRDIVVKDGPEIANDENVDYNLFYDEVLPNLVKRVPAFKIAKVINAWHMYEDANTFDSAPIIGEHLGYDNFFQMCGLAGAGSQLSIAIGKLYSERMFDAAYTTINVRKFDMRRIMQGKRYEPEYRCT